jgi:hypothetical protein
MSFAWANYLAAASHLVEYSESSGYAEACLRSAISRAYYAALNTARNLLRDQWGIEVPETAEVHRFVSQWLIAEEDLDRKEIVCFSIGFVTGGAEQTMMTTSRNQPLLPGGRSPTRNWS